MSSRFETSQNSLPINHDYCLSLITTQQNSRTLKCRQAWLFARQRLLIFAKVKGTSLKVKDSAILQRTFSHFLIVLDFKKSFPIIRIPHLLSHFWGKRFLILLLQKCRQSAMLSALIMCTNIILLIYDWWCNKSICNVANVVILIENIEDSNNSFKKVSFAHNFSFEVWIAAGREQYFWRIMQTYNRGFIFSNFSMRIWATDRLRAFIFYKYLKRA